MRSLVSALVLSLVLDVPSVTESPSIDYLARKQEAERFYAEGSFRLARERYAPLEEIAMPSERRWVRFRVADAQWRAEALTSSRDWPSSFAAVEVLEEMSASPQRDRVRAEASESLADFHATSPASRNPEKALPAYEKALSWWIEEPEGDEARSRFLALVHKVVAPPSQRNRPTPVLSLPLPLARHAVRLARTPVETGLANLLLARVLSRWGGSPGDWTEISSAFETAVSNGTGTAWHDQALSSYASWISHHGAPLADETGRGRAEPDLRKAVALYDRLLAEFPKGESRYRDSATHSRRHLAAPQASVSVSHTFLPGSPVVLALSWRNVRTIDLELYRLGSADWASVEGRPGTGQIHAAFEPRAENRVCSFTFETGDVGDHRPGRAQHALESALEPGTYLLVASSSAGSVRDLVVVSDLAVAARSVGGRTLVYCADAIGGTPVAGVQLRLFRPDGEKGPPVWRGETGVTGPNGLAWMSAATEKSRLFASIGDRQVVGRMQGSFDGADSMRGPGLDIHAISDRAAYRPQEKIEWKVVVRPGPGGRQEPMEGRSIRWTLNGPTRAVAREGTAVLNAWGSASGSISLGKGWAPGIYHLTVWEGTAAASAPLFLLERHPSPDLRVSLGPPRDGTRARAFESGTPALLELSATDGVGAPVAGATVEALAWKRPASRDGEARSEPPWYSPTWRIDEMDFSRPEVVVHRQTLRTGTDGRAALEIPTKREWSPVADVVVQARVRDDAGHEVVVEGLARTTSHDTWVELKTRRAIFRPDDRVVVSVFVSDALGQPLGTRGRVTLTRTSWDAAQQKTRTEPVASRRVAVGARGLAEVSLDLLPAGSYTLSWESDVTPSRPHVTSATFRVSDPEGTFAWPGRNGALALYVEREPSRAGQSVPVLVTAREPGLTVLLAVEGDGLDRVQVFRMTGTSRTVEIPLNANDSPNATVLASSFRDGHKHDAFADLLVLPVDRFLDVSVKPDRVRYRPGDEAVVTISTRDSAGRPVPAELSLSVADDPIADRRRNRRGDPRWDLHVQRRRSAGAFGGPIAPVRRLIRISDGRWVEDDSAPGEEERLRVAREKQDKRDPSARKMGTDAPRAEVEERVQPEAVVAHADLGTTAFWKPDVITDSGGKATVRIRLPASPRTWKVVARAVTTWGDAGLGKAVLVATGPTRRTDPVMVEASPRKKSAPPASPAGPGPVPAALAYLLDRPWGSAEETVNRFLPALVATGSFRSACIPAAEAEARLLPREYRGPGPQGLQALTREGLEKLQELSVPDGGWSLHEPNEADLSTTARVLWSLSLGPVSVVTLSPSLRYRTSRFLEEAILATDRTEAAAFALLALASSPDEASRRSPAVRKTFDRLFPERRRIGAGPRALLALAAKHLGYETGATVLTWDLPTGVVVHRPAPDLPSTAHWPGERPGDRAGEVEATALTLMALLRLDPKSDLIDPAARWLASSLEGSRGSGTRDSALAVLALSGTLARSDAAGPCGPAFPPGGPQRPSATAAPR